MKSIISHFESVDYALLKRRLLPNAPLGYWDDGDFDEDFASRKIKDAVGFRMSKKILVGPSCFKCNFNLFPYNARHTECGLPGHLCFNHCLEPISIPTPKKAVCDFYLASDAKQR